MNDWIEQLKKEKQQEQLSGNSNETFSLAPEQPLVDSTPKPKEAITQLGSDYSIKSVTKPKEEKKEFPALMLLAAVLIPVVLLIIIGIVSKGANNKDDSKSFLFNTLESKYFTINHGPDYKVVSAVDKKVPFLEKHELTSTQNGQKRLTIVIKDVKFDYDLQQNSNLRARRDASDLYTEEPFTLQSREGFYLKKRDENFEHMIIVMDRSNSLLYEIQFFSDTSLAKNDALEAELKEFLNSFTFL